MLARRVSLTTLGCKLNHAETSSLERDFVQRGWTVVPFGEASDLIVVNTCSVTENADTECRKIVRRGLRSSPSAQVAVTGCYAQLKPDVVSTIPGVTSVFGSAEKHTIPNYYSDDPSGTPLILMRGAGGEFATPMHPSHSNERVAQRRGEFSVEISSEVSAPFVPARTSDTSSRTRAFVKLQDGCDYGCTFCTIPLARGAARAMSFDDVRRELLSVQERGYAEAVLTGINLGEYEHDGRRFVDVLRLIAEMHASGEITFRVRISSIEPNTITPEVIDVLASSRVFCPHLHIPLQSGSVDVLKIMRRRYNPTMYRNTIEQLVARLGTCSVADSRNGDTDIRDCGIGIDTIVGFPGETDAHFEESVAFLESLPFSYLHVFTYSERSNTPAVEYAGRVPMRIRRERNARLRALSHEREQAFARRMVGTRRVVIPEGYDVATGLNNALTDNYIRVHIASASPMPKTTTNVIITNITNERVMAVQAR